MLGHSGSVCVPAFHLCACICWIQLRLRRRWRPARRCCSHPATDSSGCKVECQQAERLNEQEQYPKVIFDCEYKHCVKLLLTNHPQITIIQGGSLFVSLTHDWSVPCRVGDGVVPNEAVKQLHRYGVPAEGHRAAGDLLQLHCRTSWGCCTGGEIRAGRMRTDHRTRYLSFHNRRAD